MGYFSEVGHFYFKLRFFVRAERVKKKVCSCYFMVLLITSIEDATAAAAFILMDPNKRTKH